MKLDTTCMSRKTIRFWLLLKLLIVKRDVVTHLPKTKQKTFFVYFFPKMQDDDLVAKPILLLTTSYVTSFPSMMGSPRSVPVSLPKD